MTIDEDARVRLSAASSTAQIPQPWTLPRQPAALTLLKYTGVGLASSLFVLLLIKVGAVVAVDPRNWWLVLTALLVGYLGADLLSGTVHWFCDSFFSERTPLLGPIVIQPFREHHTHPQRILHYRFIDQDTTNFFLMTPLLGWALYAQAPHSGHHGQLVACSALLGLCTGSFLTNLFHKWAHSRRPPKLARLLQQCGLILSPGRHSVHHRDHSRGFCVTSGWLNPTLDAIRFFPTAERLIRRLLPR